MVVLTFALLAVLAVVPAPALIAPGSCLLPPVATPIVDPFRDPSCPWCPGNRGLTYATAPDTAVRAAAAGTVTFSGVVAGTRYVVVDHGDGRRATYGGLAGSAVRVGDHVAAGTIVGRSGAELHFGLREGEVYIDPAPLLARPVERARLVPTDGTPPRPAPPPRLRCPPARAA
jgi:murein DD-endopeptidase MepM/ murein hydrolase activator NlpD